MAPMDATAVFFIGDVDDDYEGFFDYDALDAEWPSEEKAVEGISAEDRAKMTDSSEKHEFQAEVNSLIDININSRDTDKQLLLRD